MKSTLMYSISESLIRDINITVGETVGAVIRRIEASRGPLRGYKITVMTGYGDEIIGDAIRGHVIQDGDSIQFHKEDVAFPALNNKEATIARSVKKVVLPRIVIILG